MGDNALTSRVDGNVIPASDHNELVQALLIDLVPRNNSRVAEDIIGSLGRSDLRWLRSYIKEMYIGDSANNLKVYEGAAGELWLERNSNTDEIIKLKNGSIEMWVGGVLKGLIDSNGIDGQYLKNASVNLSKISNLGITNYQVFNYGQVSENTNEFVFGPLSSNALVFCEFYGDSNGSRVAVWYEFSSRRQYLATFNQPAGGALPPGIGDVGFSNFVLAGSTIREDSSDDSTGRTSLRLHIFYL